MTTNVNSLNAFLTYFWEDQKEEETLNRDVADERASPGPIINADVPKGVCVL